MTVVVASPVELARLSVGASAEKLVVVPTTTSKSMTKVRGEVLLTRATEERKLGALGTLKVGAGPTTMVSSATTECVVATAAHAAVVESTGERVVGGARSLKGLRPKLAEVAAARSIEWTGEGSSAVSSMVTTVERVVPAELGFVGLGLGRRGR
jgi:hypothetical protein